MQTHEIMWSLALAHPLDQLIVDAAIDSVADADGRPPEDVRADLDGAYEVLGCGAITGTGRAEVRARRKLIATAGYAAGSRPTVEVVPGTGRPEKLGTGGLHMFKGGGVCRFPGAARRAGHKVVYHPSTLRVVVGARWLVAWLHDMYPAALAPLLTRSHED